jgi:DNA-binding GntR family transcriptional regulator
VPDVVELFQLREALEACSARLAAKSEDRGKMEAFLERFEQSRPSVAVGDIASYYELAEAFDLAVVDLAGNGRIRSALADVWAQSAGVRRLANQNRAMILATIDEHSRIARAIADGAEVEASDAATEHIRNSLRNVIESLAWPMASRR